MNQEKIGRFIAECRKEKNLTQSQLAEKLNITDKAISKWETGKGMPDSSIMLELCNQLNINVNELLSGERLNEENYKEKANENIVSISKESEKNKKIKNKVIAIFSTILVVLLIVSTAIGIYEDIEIGIEFDDRIIKSEITDDNIEISCEGLSLINFYHKEINTDTETLIFVTGKMLLANKIHSHFETWDSMAQLNNGDEARFGTKIIINKDTDIVDCKDKIKVYYTSIPLNKIKTTKQEELQEIIEESYLVTEN